MTTQPPRPKFSVLARIWTLPNTAFGLTVGYLAVAFGASAQKVDGCWEFYGGLVTWLLQRAPIGSGAMAMTLGHSILGQSKSALDFTRQHEHVHVRQYEIWGPLFIPAYFTASAIAWSKGKDPYRDNFFEVEAYESTSINER